MKNNKITLPDNESWIKYYEKLPDQLLVNKKLFDELWNLHPEKRSTIIMRGKEIEVPRWQESYGKDYYYSGKLHIGHEISHSYFKNLLQFVQSHSKKNYQQILVNWYSNGDNYIGHHSDDETQLVNNSSIYSFSFGQPRDFVIKSKKDPDYKKVIKLENNSMVVMGGKMQKNYTHSIPKRSVKKCPYRRINITFRLFTS